MMRLRLMLLAMCAATLTACGDAQPDAETAVPPAADDAQLNSAEVTQSYAPELDIDLSQMTRTASGLYTQDLTVGTGDVAEVGDAVSVHYTGWLANGEQFDTSRGGTPFDVVIGTGEVIDGWDEGVPGMRVGGTRRLVIPPALGYGAAGAGFGLIPPGATLIFEVELVEVR